MWSCVYTLSGHLLRYICQSNAPSLAVLLLSLFYDTYVQLILSYLRQLKLYISAVRSQLKVLLCPPLMLIREIKK